MNVYKKLQEARLKLQAMPLTKSGKNKFAGYEYFELSDFMPAIQKICGELGLCGVVSFNHEYATLTIYDTDGEGFINFGSPMSSAALKGCHEVQNLGAVQSYLRRYLWVNAFEIVEHDALDSTTGAIEPVKPKAEVKPAPKTVIPDRIEGMEGEWQINVNKLVDGEEAGWLAAVEAGADLALGHAASSDDVMQIFKKNKILFDTVKKVDPDFFKTLMAKFTEVKNKFS
jgi:hypothetical protein